MESRIEAEVRKILGSDVSKVELWGPIVAVYVNSLAPYYADRSKLKELAGLLKRKVVVRTEPNRRSSAEITRSLIEELAKEAKITNVWFSEPFGEVVIEAYKPGIVIGKGGENLHKIAAETGWSPVVRRTPTMPSFTVEGVRKSTIAQAESRKKFLQRLGQKLLKAAPETTWIRAVMLGAFKEVGRSALLIQTKHSKILLDAGVHTGLNPLTADKEELYPYINLFNFPVNELDGVVISHAHMDHIGFLPFLFAAGYNGPVYMTPPTRELMALLQLDYLNLLSKAYNANPPYTKKDISHELNNVIPVEYGEVVDITPEVKLTLYNAGHILGSAIIHLHIGEGKHNVIYTGDFKFGYTKLLNPANADFPRADTIFMESTYGGAKNIMPNRRESDEKLMKIIRETIEKKGKVLIPVFAVGRSQEVLLTIESFAREDKDWNIPIYIDGMILEASAIHTAYPEYLKTSLQRRILSNDSPFEFEHLKIAHGVDKQSITEGEPAVILAPSGMLTGGPSVEYLKLLAEDEKSTLIFVGYQSALSLGAKIQQGIRDFQLPTDDKIKHYTLKMRVETVEGFSGHSDRRQLLAWIKNLKSKPRRVYTMHGDFSRTEELANGIHKLFGIHAETPWDMEARRLR